MRGQEAALVALRQAESATKAAMEVTVNTRTWTYSVPFDTQAMMTIIFFLCLAKQITTPINRVCKGRRWRL
jgi:hypothetical protein